MNCELQILMGPQTFMNYGLQMLVGLEFFTTCENINGSANYYDLWAANINGFINYSHNINGSANFH